MFLLVADSTILKPWYPWLNILIKDYLEANSHQRQTNGFLKMSEVDINPTMKRGSSTFRVPTKKKWCHRLTWTYHVNVGTLAHQRNQSTLPAIGIMCPWMMGKLQIFVCIWNVVVYHVSISLIHIVIFVDHDIQIQIYIYSAISGTASLSLKNWL